MDAVGQPPKYAESFSTPNVADMSTSFSGGGAIVPASFASHASRRRATSSRSATNRNSVSRSSSWTSSKMKCVYSTKSGSDASFLSKTPGVANSNLVLDGWNELSNRTWYPTTLPHASPRSAATRSATAMADSRRGWEHAIRAVPDVASKRNCGTCVDLPQPVSPATRTTSFVFTRSTTFRRASHAGSDDREATMAAGVDAGGSGGASYDTAAADDRARFLTFLDRPPVCAPGSGDARASATRPARAAASSALVGGNRAKCASSAAIEPGARSSLGASSASATTRRGFDTVKNRSAPLPCDFVARPSFGACACTNRRSSEVSVGGNRSSTSGDAVNAASCFSIRMRQTSLPGVKPDIGVGGWQSVTALAVRRWSCGGAGAPRGNASGG
mmetsp:Transcript_29832/g.89733  ORF Transcript_29832/g.89733 Transcript_29832/m.89733 type:complete len:388 (-) Transcript_29832:87-1250(-)